MHKDPVRNFMFDVKYFHQSQWLKAVRWTLSFSSPLYTTIKHQSSFTHHDNSSSTLGPKYTGILGVNAQGSWNQTAWSLQRAIYYTMKQDLETVLYKPMCHRGFQVSCAVYCVSGGVWLLTLSLPLQSPFTWPSLQYPLFKLSQLFCLQGTWFYTIFSDTCNAWYMVLGPWVDLINCSLNQNECLTKPPLTEGSWFTH